LGILGDKLFYVSWTSYILVSLWYLYADVVRKEKREAFMRKKSLSLAVLLLVCLPLKVASQTVLSEKQQPLTSFSVAVSPLGFLPAGSDANLFSFGGGAEAAFSWRLSSLP